MTTRPDPLKRSSTSKAPGPPLSSQPTTLISTSAVLKGTHPISLGSNVIIQLRSCLSSTFGPIDIADGCIISEQVSIGVLSIATSEDEAGGNATAGVKLAQGVLVESGAIVEAASIGAFTVIETGARIGRGAILGNNCKVCAHTEIDAGATVDNDTVVYGRAWGMKRGPVREGKRDEWGRQQGENLRRVWTGK